jgi:hypothetical protein
VTLIDFLAIYQRTSDMLNNSRKQADKEQHKNKKEKKRKRNLMALKDLDSKKMA